MNAVKFKNFYWYGLITKNDWKFEQINIKAAECVFGIILIYNVG
jgi:hypothetical protein